ncbi:MAG: hypothetical protein A2Y23_12405 [Clostridiales bacterium GWB2_37_7]|nr:MAG: hypothetical protein A2Y23_12405 [Clostridiales bacterium GWB2_37_7]
MVQGTNGSNEDRTMKHSTTQRTTMEDRFNEDNLNDVSLYGEFVSTFHNWVSSEDLHAKGEYLQRLGRTH